MVNGHINPFLSFLWLLCYHQCAGRRYHNVSGIGNGGVHRPQSHLVSHEVDVRGAPPTVGKCVVVARAAQAPLEQHAARAEMILHLERHVARLSPALLFERHFRLLPGCCSGACCSTGTRCRPRGPFQPRRGAAGAAQSSVPLQNPPWFCIPARVCLYSSRPLTTPRGGTSGNRGAESTRGPSDRPST